MATAPPNPHYLIPLAGPSMDPLRLDPELKSLTLGRHDSCELLLPADADKVSRYHARFTCTDGHWSITDLSSRWGTFVNGRKLAVQQPLPLTEGDLIRVLPWTFMVSPTAVPKGLSPNSDDVGQTMVRSSTRESYQSQRIADSLLTVLLEAAAALHGAESEENLFTLLIDYARRGAGLPNASILRRVGADDKIDIVLSTLDRNEGLVFSKSMLATASTGNVAEFSSLNVQADISTSLADANVASALCVPLMLNNTVAAYLYLDSRGRRAVPFADAITPNTSAFCVALARIASLALANLKRIEMERRQASFEKELSAGAEAQRFIMPPRQGKSGPFSYLGESRPGRHVGGDFFDVVPLSPSRLVVALGDVAGKGIAAAVLMSAAQGFLHDALRQSATLADAVTALNVFICPRCADSKFLTLFVALLDLDAGELTAIDAGHGYALFAPPGAPFDLFPGSGNLPIGISAEVAYESVTLPLAPGARLLLISDGFIEQPSLTSATREQFDLIGVQTAMNLHTTDPIAALFSALISHAGTVELADDATAVLVSV
jgi:sigma-B regulation protein RsbU (phosphoserine phosphatase)